MTTGAGLVRRRAPLVVALSLGLASAIGGAGVVLARCGADVPAAPLSNDAGASAPPSPRPAATRPLAPLGLPHAPPVIPSSSPSR